jgi:hypothetical protein
MLALFYQSSFPIGSLRGSQVRLETSGIESIRVTSKVRVFHRRGERSPEHIAA